VCIERFEREHAGSRLGGAAERAHEIDLDDAKASIGKCLISFVALSRDAVLNALPVPAQFTRMRSCPSAARDLAKPASTSASDVTSTLQKIPPTELASAAPFSALKSKIATLTP
jgi:hypothetical protein